MFKKLMKIISGLRFIKRLDKFPDKWEFEQNILSQTFNGVTISIKHVFENYSSKLICEIDGKVKVAVEDDDGFIYRMVFHFYYNKLHKLNTEKSGYNLDEKYVYSLIDEIVRATREAAKQN